MEAALSGPLSAVAAASASVSDALGASTEMLRRIVSLADETVSSPARTRAALGPLGGAMGDLVEAEESTSPVHILHHHMAAVAAAASAFAWVADPDPLAAVRRAHAAAEAPIAALRAKDVPHADLADAVHAFLNALEAFVKLNHQEPLVFVDEDPGEAEAAPPAAAAETAAYDDSHTAPHLVAFRESIAHGALNEFAAAAAALGGLVKTQADAVEDAFFKTYQFLVDASGKSKPSSQEALQNDLAPIGIQMGVVAEFPTKCPPRDLVENHLTAVAEAINMLSWVSAESRPVSFVSDAEAAAAFYLNKVLTTTKSEAKAADHRAYVQAVRKLITEMKVYIKEHHTMGVTYNVGIHACGAPQGSSVGTAPPAAEEEEGEGTYVAKFNELIEGRVAAYVAASDVLGSEVAQQAAALQAAFKAEADFLGKAISMPKPDDIQDMLAPIAKQMGDVAAITEKMDPRGPLTNHCTAVSEAVSALGWVAVEEKATVFVGDMAAAGQFFLDKVKMGAKNTDNPTAHREWAKCLEALFIDLKTYVGEYHTQKLVWNPPKKMKPRSAPGGTSECEEGASGDYVTKFEDFINEAVVPYAEASKKIGGPVLEQSNAFLAAFRAEAAFLKKAIAMPKPEDIQSLLAPIAAEMGNVSSVSEKVGPRGQYANHCTAISESVSALGWVAVDEKATAFVGDMSGAGQFFLDKVKMGAKNTEDPAMHREWAKSVEAIFTGLKAYVKEHHTQKLVWNPPKRAVKKPATSRSAGESNGSSGGDYVGQFKDLMDGPLAAFVTASSSSLGGDVEEQAKAFAAAWEAEAEFLAKAIAMKRPDDIQSMLGPIANKMGAVSAVSEKMDPRGPLANHCTAVSESVGALGWVAVEEKAAVFVGDMAGAGQFFIDKVKMAARNTDNPAAHLEWAKALENLLKDLKAYVKEHHTQKLTWKR